MKNAEYNAMHIKSVCEKKLGISFKCHAECNGWFIYKEKKISRVTVPKGRKTVSRKTYQKMAEQLKLTLEQFDSLLACPLTFEKYVEILSGQGLIQ